MTTTEKISATDMLLALAEDAKPHLGGSVLLKNSRKEALKSFAKQGLPGRKHEEYKYSQPEKLFSDKYTVQHEAFTGTLAIDKFYIPSLNANTAVLVNGKYSEKLSSIKDLPAGVIIESLETASEKHSSHFEKHFSKIALNDTDAFIALNTSLFSNGVFVFVPDNVSVEKPLHIINIVTSKNNILVSARNLFVVGKNASISIVESFDTYDLDVAVVSNTLTEVAVGDEARVQYYKLQNDCENGNQINTTHASVGAKAHFDTNTVILNGSWIRNNLTINVNGEFSEVHLNGLFLTKGNQHIDNHTAVDHRVPNCQSNQLYKGILNDKSTGVFNGKIFVQRDAQKTNTYQSSKNILLSDNATINTKPQLEIYADDVKCSHGSTTGQIDPDAMFYLRSRGLGEDSAKNLLMYAFAADVVSTIRIDAVREYVDALIGKRLEH